MKKILTTILTIIIAVSLVGCKKEDKITFWNPLTGDDGAFMEKIVEEYNATDPEFKVESIITPDMYTKLFTVINAGKGIPDLTLIHAHVIQQFGKLDLMEPVSVLQEYNPNLVKENYLEQAWNSGEYDGIQYTIPLDIHGNVMYYNKDLLSKYGVEHFLDDNIVTVDEMLQLAGKMEEGDYVVNNALFEWVTFGNLVALGGSLSDESGNPTLDTPEMRQVIQKLKELADNGLLTPYGEDGYAMFQAGNVLFSTDGTWTSTAHDSIDGLDYGVTNVYSTSDGSKFYNRSSAHLFSILKNNERSEEKVKGIADFLDFVRENSLVWAEAGQIVASKEIFESEEYTKYPQSFFTSTEEEKESLYIFDYEYYNYAEQALASVLNDIVYGNVDIDEGMKKAQDQLKDLIEESEKSN
ncbi:MAG: extracellular solute-binding protein [Erysipelothrix sp.]|nr:extracellular solute-binding protein [Erysipelothrix sp.]